MLIFSPAAAPAQRDEAQPAHSQPAVSQAGQEAEKKVSLSAAKIIEILRNEPGLLLVVKKMLLCRAYKDAFLIPFPIDLESLRRTFYLSEDFDRSRGKVGCNSVFAPCDVKLTGLHLKPIGKH